MLLAENNLSDIIDVTAARNNLSVYSRAQIDALLVGIVGGGGGGGTATTTIATSWDGSSTTTVQAYLDYLYASVQGFRDPPGLPQSVTFEQDVDRVLVSFDPATGGADEYRVDVLRALRWLHEKGYHSGAIWKAAVTQNVANNGSAGDPYLWASATYSGSTSNQQATNISVKTVMPSVSARN
jgi:hypothetical protein